MLICLDGFTRQKALGSSASSEVVLAVRDADQLALVLKAYADDRRAGDRTRVEREFETLRACAGPGVPQAFAVLRDQQPYVLALE